MIIKDTKQYKFYALFGMILITTKLISMIFVGRTLLFGNFIMPGGIIPFCTTFMILDIVTNNYGLEKAKKMILYLLVCEAIFTLMMYITLKIPTSSLQNETSYSLITNSVTRVYFGSFCATITAYLLNCYIFSKLYNLYFGQKLWLRCILSTAAGELIFSLVWTSIYFYDKLNNKEILILILDQYTFKILFEVVTLPITYLIVYILEKYEVPLEINYKDSTQLDSQPIFEKSK